MVEESVMILEKTESVPHETDLCSLYLDDMSNVLNIPYGITQSQSSQFSTCKPGAACSIASVDIKYSHISCDV